MNLAHAVDRRPETTLPSIDAATPANLATCTFALG